MEPIHQHDCDSCIYVGSFTWVRYSREHADERQLQHDCYVCPSKPVNLVVRFGELGEYASGVEFMRHSKTIRMAYELAIANESLNPVLKARLALVAAGL